MDNTLSVYQLNTFLNRIMQSEMLLQNISVYGEISSFKFSGAHAYFTLKDKDAQIQCSCFNARKTYTPKSDGESVIVKGSMDYYVKGGKLSLIVSTIQPIGRGELHISLEQLKNKLQAEGLFEETHKKAIPQFCKRVCVLTSKTGAVIKDIVKTVRNKNRLINIELIDVRVQGESAALDIIKNLRIADTLGYDCIIVARGGGSFEDLMPFNDERLIRAIFDCDTPIISAIGHESDYSLCDFVADVRAATPTAAAELIAYDVRILKEYIAELAIRMGAKVVDRHKFFLEKTKATVVSMSDKTLRLVDRGDKLLTFQLSNLKEKITAVQTLKEKSFSNILTRLNANNPVRLLQSGYFKVTSSGQTIVSVNSLTAGDRILLTGADGRVDCEVQHIIQNKLKEVKDEL